MRKALGCLVSLVVVGVLAGALFGPLVQAQRRFGPPATDLSLIQRWRLSVTLLVRGQAVQQPVVFPQREITIHIPAGASAAEVAGLLWERGVISDPAAFLAYLIYTGADRRLQQGTYRLVSPLSAQQVAQWLQDPQAQLTTVRVLPGWRREEIAANLDAGSRLSGADFLIATAHAVDYDLPFAVPAEASLEGFLYPSTYTLGPNDSAEDLVRAMIAQFTQIMTPDLQAAFAAQGLTPYQALILASIVQREAVLEEEMPLIASVYLNRLRAGMPLEADPTVQYALGRPGQWWKSPLDSADLQVDSPFNTYRHAGLPPAPIANPGLQALRAVAFPAESPYLFFRAACDGSGRHVFSKTYQEHLQNGCP